MSESFSPLPDPVRLGDGVVFDNAGPLAIIAGMNVIEDRDTLHQVAEALAKACQARGAALVFKASFDKANRSSIASFRGPGLRKGLECLAEIKARHGLPILTDVHEPGQAAPAAEVADILQIPAFLARQTDLVAAVARTGAVVNVKKPQFLAPAEMVHIIRKCRDAGNDRVLLCERGTTFGYNNLVVDMLGLDSMKALAPVIFDVTHALQKPGGLSDRADGRGQQTMALARAGVAVGIAGLFVEVHPDPAQAKCDGPSALPMDRFAALLDQVMAVDAAVKA